MYIGLKQNTLSWKNVFSTFCKRCLILLSLLPLIVGAAARTERNIEDLDDTARKVEQAR